MIEKKFKKSSFSNADREIFSRCVEVCIEEKVVTVRHTKNYSVEIQYSPEEWDAFIKGVKNNEFDLKKI